MTRRPWRFLDFVNERGENEIMAWMNREGMELKARVNALVRQLELVEGAFERADSVGLLRKRGTTCYGEKLIELIIKIQKVQYRPIGWYGPEARTVTLLVGAKERDGDFDPRNACDIAVRRKKLVSVDRTKHAVEHDFG